MPLATSCPDRPGRIGQQPAVVSVVVIVGVDLGGIGHRQMDDQELL